MAAPKGHAKWGGRKKGSSNKATAAVKAALAAAFDRLGGVDFLTEWGRENPTEFLRLWAKLLPLEVRGEGGGPVRVSQVTEVVVRTRAEAVAFLALEGGNG